MIFVTGGTGLIGSHLILELTRSGKSVKALKRKNSDLDLVKRLMNSYGENADFLFEKIQWIEGDIEDYATVLDAIRDLDEVYHCAAMVSFSKQDTNRMLEINVGGTANIVEACLELGDKKLCYVSSVASLGSSADGSPVVESTLWGKSKGKSGYALSKFRSEMEVWRGVELGLQSVIVNPSVIIGPSSWNNGSGKLFGTISKGFPFYTEGITGFVDVRDVVKAMIVAMDKERWGKRYLLNGENLSYKEVFTLIAKSLGKKPPYIKITPLLSSIAWPLAWLASQFTRKAPAITKDTANSGHKKTYYSSALAEDELGIKFTPIAEAIRNTTAVGDLKMI